MRLECVEQPGTLLSAWTRKQRGSSSDRLGQCFLMRKSIAILAWKVERHRSIRKHSCDVITEGVHIGHRGASLVKRGSNPKPRGNRANICTRAIPTMRCIWRDPWPASSTLSGYSGRCTCRTMKTVQRHHAQAGSPEDLALKST